MYARAWSSSSSPRTRPTSPRGTPPPSTATTLSLARAEFRWNDQINLSLDPERAREYRAKGDPEFSRDNSRPHHCSMCGPKFCSMRASIEIREAFGKKPGEGK